MCCSKLHLGQDPDEASSDPLANEEACELPQVRVEHYGPMSCHFCERELSLGGCEMHLD